MPSSSSSSPSLTILHPDLAPAPGARFNPLFIHTSGTHSQGTPKASSNSSNPMQQPGQAAEPVASRKVHVVYYLSRGGQLEHPHLLEVSIPPNQGLYLRDVKRRLAMIRGKRLPSTFAWSYKRSYKNGYVWQDLCDDDLIFPAHGCEYVLKGSEILSDESKGAAGDECAHASAPSHRAVAASAGSREEQGHAASGPSKMDYRNYDEAAAAVGSHVHSLQKLLVNGTDAETQTEEELRPSIESMYEQAEETSRNNIYGNYSNPTLKKSPHRQGSYSALNSQNAIELNKSAMTSPPSSSSATNSPSPFKEMASTSSSSASEFSISRSEHASNINSNQISNQENIADQSQLGSKTPGRSWMKRPTQNFDEPEEIVSIHAGDQGATNPTNTLIENQVHESISKSKHKAMASNSIGAVIMEDVDVMPPSPVAKPNRSKHSGALSLLQFMSCGGIDIKEQILPMSLYRLRSKGQLHMNKYMVSPEHPSEVFGYGHCPDSLSTKSWQKMERPVTNLFKNNSKLLFRASNDYTDTPAKVDKQVSEGINNTFNHRLNPSQRDGNSGPQATSSSPMSNGSSAFKAVIPDVISIGRSSTSDRSTSRESEYHATAMDSHWNGKKSSEILPSCVCNLVNATPRVAGAARPTTSLDGGNNTTTNVQAGAIRAVSGEILMSKGSPLFVPGKRHLSYSGTPLTYTGFNKPPLAAQLADTTNALAFSSGGGRNSKLDSSSGAKPPSSAGSCNPSRAFSEGEVSSLLVARTAACWSKSGEQRSTAANNGYDRSMAELWEELLAAPTAHFSSQEQAESQRVRQVTMVGTASEMEMRDRTLQNALDLSLHPPLELLVPECPHCGRKVKAELLKGHVKNCSSPKSSGKVAINLSNICHHSSLGKSPKSDSNRCQRFLRASPPSKI